MRNHIREFNVTCCCSVLKGDQQLQTSCGNWSVMPYVPTWCAMETPYPGFACSEESILFFSSPFAYWWQVCSKTFCRHRWHLTPCLEESCRADHGAMATYVYLLLSNQISPASSNFSSQGSISSYFVCCVQVYASLNPHLSSRDTICSLFFSLVFLLRRLCCARRLRLLIDGGILSD